MSMTKVRSMMMSGGLSSLQPSSSIAASMEAKLRTHFQPLFHLEIRNESHRHNVPLNSETHFKIILVTDAFQDVVRRNDSASTNSNENAENERTSMPSKSSLPLVQRHRWVHDVLKEELSRSGSGGSGTGAGSIHALSLVLKTTDEWQTMIQKQESEQLPTSSGSVGPETQKFKSVEIEPSPSCLGGDGSLPPRNQR
jgi:stress-induced morphogen